MKYTSFFQERIPNLPTPNDKGEVMVPCVFHKDSSPSLGINLETGKWKCFATHCPGHAGGGYKKFDSAMRGEFSGGKPIAVEPIAETVVDGFHLALLAANATLGWLERERGITLDAVKRFKLGWDGDRLWIPIRDATGQVVNIRRYKPNHHGKDKVLPYSQAYNQPRLFPMASLESEWVLLTEGETDTLLALSLGFPAITGTGGAGVWTKEFSQAFAGKKVVVCYDVDKAGTKGAAEVAAKLLSFAGVVHRLTLPLNGESEGKDLTDYVVKGKHTAEDLKELVRLAPQVEPMVESAKGPSEEVLPLHLSAIGEERYVGKRVSSTVLVAGKDLAPFQVPRVVAFSCQMGEKMCSRCQLADAGGRRTVTLPEWDPQLLQMVNVHQMTVESVLGRACGVPFMCHKFTYEVKEHANIEALKVIPEIDFTSDRSEYVIRQVFYLGHGLETNHTYDIEAVVMPEPKTQYATAIVYKATSSKDNIEEFTLDEETLAMLSMFKVTAP